MKIPKTARRHWAYKAFWTKEKREAAGCQISEGRRDNLQAPGEEESVRGQQGLAGQLGNTGTHAVWLRGPCLMACYLPHLIQIRLRQRSKIPFLSASLGQEKAEGQRFCLFFLNKQLKINIPQRSFRVAKFRFPSASRSSVGSIS